MVLAKKGKNMDNTDSVHYMKNNLSDSVTKQDLPPLSPNDMLSKRRAVCAAVRLYLAIWNDLSLGQMRLISNHLRICQSCAHEHELFQKAEKLIVQLPERQPSPGVDRAVLDAIAARSQSSTRTSASSHKEHYFSLPFKKHSHTSPSLLPATSRLSLRMVAL